jgi:hypothetical protein
MWMWAPFISRREDGLPLFGPVIRRVGARCGSEETRRERERCVRVRRSTAQQTRLRVRPLFKGAARRQAATHAEKIRCSRTLKQAGNLELQRRGVIVRGIVGRWLLKSQLASVVAPAHDSSRGRARQKTYSGKVQPQSRSGIEPHRTTGPKAGAVVAVQRPPGARQAQAFGAQPHSASGGATSRV